MELTENLKRLADKENQLHGWCSRNGVKYIYAKPTKKSTLPEGWPDETLFYKGTVLFMELKVGRDILSPIQEIIISELREQGFIVVVAHTYAYAIQQATKHFLLC